MTPATSTAPPTSTSPTNATRTPLVIPDRTSLPFQSINQLSGHIGSEDPLDEMPEVFVLTSPEDIIKIEEAIPPDDQESLENLDYSSNLVVAVYGQNTRDLGNTLNVRMVFHAADQIQSRCMPSIKTQVSRSKRLQVNPVLR